MLTTTLCATETYLARQPIFDHRQKVYAYELLFRSGLTSNFCDETNLNHAASKVIADCCSMLGPQSVTNGKRAFINVTREVLLSDYASLLPKDIAVVELLETVEPDEAVVAACRKLKDEGYLLALDDFVHRDDYRALVELADIIKVDFLSTKRAEQQALADALLPRGVKLLAEKVETREVYEDAVKMGYSYFQGYFFCKPEIIARRDVPGFKMNYFRILQEVQRPELDFGEIEAIIKRDVSLSYKFLRYINSATFSLRNEVSSVRQALNLLGETPVKKWVSLITLTSMAQDKPAELVMQALIRAKFCELLAPGARLKARANELFLMGMLSLIDAIMDQTLSSILTELPISEEVKVALLDGGNRLGDVHQFVLAYERGDWGKLAEQSARLEFDESLLPHAYLEAVEWVQQSMQSGAFN
jgi:c-di-GMP-related signal transduction protein